jgi:murein DD-endopeptidase MepM/ murein hydrolase activator NlpD
MRLINFFLFLFLFSPLFSTYDVHIKGKIIESGLIEVSVPDSVVKILLNKREIPFLDNKCYIGFARKDSLVQEIVFTYENNSVQHLPLILEERTYHLQYIDQIPSEYVEKPIAPELISRINKESKIISAVRKNIIFPNKNLYFDKMIQPVSGRYSSAYGDQRILNNTPQRPHYGLDIAAPLGTPVKACADGVVVLHDDFYYNGNFVLLDHGLGLSSIYVHMDEIKVHTGQFVKMGEVVGTVGKSGRATGPHLHWGFFWFENALDPLLVFEAFRKVETE